MFKDLATVITIISLSAFFTLIGGCSSNTSTSKTSSTPGSKMSAKGPMPSKDVEFERVTDNAPAIAKPGVSDVEFERVTQAAPPAPPAPKSSDVEFEKVGGQGEVEQLKVITRNDDMSIDQKDILPVRFVPITKVKR